MHVLRIERAADSRAAATHPVPVFRIELLVSAAVAEVVLETARVWEAEAVVWAAATVQADLGAAAGRVDLAADRVVVGAAAEPA